MVHKTFSFSLQNAYPMEIHFVTFNTKYGSNLGDAIAGGAGSEDTLAVLGK